VLKLVDGQSLSNHTSLTLDINDIKLSILNNEEDLNDRLSLIETYMRGGDENETPAIIDDIINSDALSELMEIREAELKLDEFVTSKDLLEFYGDNIENNFVQASQFKREKDAFNFSLTTGGGVNLIRNGSGYGKFENWSISFTGGYTMEIPKDEDNFYINN